MRIDLYGKVKMNDYRCRSGGTEDGIQELIHTWTRQ